MVWSLHPTYMRKTSHLKQKLLLSASSLFLLSSFSACTETMETDAVADTAELVTEPAPVMTITHDDSTQFDSRLYFETSRMTPEQLELYNTGCIPHSTLLSDGHQFEMWVELYETAEKSATIPAGGKLTLTLNVCDDPIIDPLVAPEAYASGAGSIRPGIRFRAIYGAVDVDGNLNGQRARVATTLTAPSGDSIGVKTSYDLANTEGTWHVSRIKDRTMAADGFRNEELSEFYPIWQESGTYTLSFENKGRTDVKLRSFVYEVWYAYGEAGTFRH